MAYDEAFQPSSEAPDQLAWMYDYGVGTIGITEAAQAATGIEPIPEAAILDGPELALYQYPRKSVSVNAIVVHPDERLATIKKLFDYSGYVPAEIAPTVIGGRGIYTILSFDISRDHPQEMQETYVRECFQQDWDKSTRDRMKRAGLGSALGGLLAFILKHVAFNGYPAIVKGADVATARSYGHMVGSKVLQALA